ncbi:MAG: P1 family peptidase [Gammaproteobacteria bacterium]|nr:P1 family peptidase [Gammaproteobacteria bacterium]
MKGLKVGHYTHEMHGTGASVFIFDESAVGAYCLCGSSPASHELGTLALDANVTHVNGLALLGGSAFGLPAVNGMMRWLHEQKRGWATPHGAVPIVPAAAIYDLGVKKDLPPTEFEVYEACVLAKEDNKASGRIGAGTGASVGKVIQKAKRMSGGLGRAEISLPNGTSVLAYAVVNAVGDVLDESGRILAGARLENGEFGNCENYLLSGAPEENLSSENTTLIALFTNARFSKIELGRIAKMAIAGMARAISPIFSRYDGDLVFAFSLGDKVAAEMVVGAMAAQAIQRAIMNAVEESIILA